MKTFKKAPLAVAIASLFISGSVLAWNYTPPAEETGFEASSSITSTVTNTKEISVTHDTDFSSDIDVNGSVYLWGKGYVGALTDSKQMNEDNLVNNNKVNNSTGISGDAFRGANGNIGANVAGGDNNQQANDAALAASDANWVFARATTASFQSSSENATTNNSVSNTAGLSGNVFQNSSGNIGVNAAAGTGNSQQNTFSAAVSNNGSAEAASVGVQQSYGNVTDNDLAQLTVKTLFGTATIDGPPVNNSANISGNAFRGASGNVGVNVASGTGNMQRNSLAIAAGQAATQ